MAVYGLRIFGGLLFGVALLVTGCFTGHPGGADGGLDDTSDDSAASASSTASGGGSLTAASSSGGSSASGSSTTNDDDGGSAESGSSSSTGGEPVEGATDPNLRVAFLGDSGKGSNFISVLELVKAENADFVIHSGDLGYSSPGAEDWHAVVDAALGESYPYFASIGNHDAGEWDKYSELLGARLAKIEGADCKGEYGVKMACHYRGLFFLLSGVGETGSGHEEFIASELEADKSIWSVCSWHKNQREMQVGSKGNQAGWGGYQACQDGGAIIATAHEHSYARTKTLTAIGNSDASHGAYGENEVVRVNPGESFVFVSGLGGASIRVYAADLHETSDWWASILTSDYFMKNGEIIEDFKADYGALFIDFYVDGDPYKARAYFKTTAGLIADEFEIVTE